MNELTRKKGPSLCQSVNAAFFFVRTNVNEENMQMTFDGLLSPDASVRPPIKAARKHVNGEYIKDSTGNFYCSVNKREPSKVGRRRRRRRRRRKGVSFSKAAFVCDTSKASRHGKAYYTRSRTQMLLPTNRPQRRL